MAELSLPKLRRLAEVQGVGVYSCEGFWIQTIWSDFCCAWEEFQMALSVRTEREALLLALERFA